MKKYDVVALGELLIDFTENGTSASGNPILEANPGGAPCNVLSMLQKLGRRTAFIGKVGDDSFGHMLADAIESQEIEKSGLVFDQTVPTTLAFVHTKEDGDRSFSFYRNPGADVMLTEEEVRSDLIEEARIFHFGTLSMTHPMVEKATKYAVSYAEANECLISFDPNLRPPLWESLGVAKEKMAYGFEHCHILKISDDEIEFFTGQKDIIKGIKQIKEEYDIPLICATLGKEGSLAFYKDLVVEGRPFIDKNTIETTGAGDTFMGCLLDGVLETGLENLNQEILARILTRANAAASIITTRRGALKVMPNLNEIEALMK